MRDFAAADLEAVVRLDGESSTTHEPPVFTLADVVGCLSSCPAVVAIAGGRVAEIGQVADLARRLGSARGNVGSDCRHDG